MLKSLKGRYSVHRLPTANPDDSIGQISHVLAVCGQMQWAQGWQGLGDFAWPLAERPPSDVIEMTAPEARAAPAPKMLTVLLVTQEDPFYIPHFFRTFCRMQAAHSDRIVIEGVIVQPSFGERKSQLAKRMLEFYGWADFLRLLGRYAGQKGLLLEKLGVRKAPESIAGICRQQRIAVCVEHDVNRPDFVERVRDAGIDLIVSVSAPQIFEQPLLEAPRHGCINIHNGRLPDYRGMLPNFWQMLNGEAYSTTTIHTMVRKLDAGGVVWEERTPIRPGTTLDALIRETKEKSAEALWRVLSDLEQNRKLTVLREISGKGSYYSFPKYRDANQLRANGHGLL